MKKGRESRVWHPNTQMSEWDAFDSIARGDGVWLVDSKGRRMIDGVASMWCNVWGHSNDELVGAMTRQAEKLQHSPLFNLTHGPAERLAERLVRLLPGMHKVMYSDNGSTGVEIAIKMALQYRMNQGDTGRCSIAALECGYHGDTYGAMAAGRIPEFFAKYIKTTPDTVTLPVPVDEMTCKVNDSTRNNSHAKNNKKTQSTPNKKNTHARSPDPETAVNDCLAEISDTLSSRHDIGTLIIESGAQLAGGVRIYHTGFQRGLYQICKENDIILVADEVATGLGRLGAMCVYADENSKPDIAIYSKMLTGGYLPLAATLATRKMYDSFLGKYDDWQHLFHGHTFTGNPVAAAVANTNLAMYAKHNLLRHVARVSKIFEEYAGKISAMKQVRGLRYRGLLMGIDLKTGMRGHARPARSINRIMYEAGRKRGVYLRTLGNVVMLVPPLAITEQETVMLVERTMNAIRDAGDEIGSV